MIDGTERPLPLTELLACHLEVLARGGDIGVAQLLLQGVEISAGHLEHLDCRGMAQQVGERAASLLQPRFKRMSQERNP